jgi:hypothetical protein
MEQLKMGDSMVFLFLPTRGWQRGKYNLGANEILARSSFRCFESMASELALCKNSLN